MNFIKVRNAFTLIELLVWITIMGIMFLWIKSIDFNRLSTKQNLEIFTNSIKIDFENIRNNSLEWKWIWTNINVPDKWKIDYSMNNSWTIISYISNDKWLTWINNNSIVFGTGYNISSIKCWKLNDSEINYDTLTNDWTWSIIFDWINMTLDLNWDLNCNLGNYKILQMILNYKWNNKTLKINTLNWIIEVK